MNLKDFLEKIYDELFYGIVVKKDFIDWYTSYFENNLKMNYLSIDDMIEYSIFFGKNRNTICKNLARNKTILKRYGIIE